MAGARERRHLFRDQVGRESRDLSADARSLAGKNGELLRRELLGRVRLPDRTEARHSLHVQREVRCVPFHVVLLPRAISGADRFACSVDESRTWNDTGGRSPAPAERNDAAGLGCAGELVPLVAVEAAGALQLGLQSASRSMKPDLRCSERDAERISHVAVAEAAKLAE